MVRVDITERMRSRAASRAERIGILPSSFTNGKGALHGFVGEYMVIDYLSGDQDAEPDDTFAYDININGYGLDVKTKRSNYAPIPRHYCDIPEVQRNQNCYMYAFCQTDFDLTVGWIVGWIRKREFFQKARFVPKGEYNEKIKWTCRESCYSLQIKHLNKIEPLKEYYDLSRDSIYGD